MTINTAAFVSASTTLAKDECDMLQESSLITFGTNRHSLISVDLCRRLIGPSERLDAIPSGVLIDLES